MTTVPPLPEPGPNQSTEDRRQIGQRFIIHTRAELAVGNRLQAGEKAWGAVAQNLKIIAERRGWNHSRHQHLEALARQLALEYDFPVLSRTPCKACTTPTLISTKTRVLTG